ncbi:transcriptional regulator SlyA [Halomonas cupida]|uniref:MarR family transcriptional regulator, transcriptional regulator for hemolysin n=1 Tax=Halomonas cupida TaxID=44933 RepID=A0A1M7MGA8_9GAMM|nr:transcriptional regulator SlyA [Halomonas cupida]GEN25801.1 transcriptional regulator SlyA [Halomonas cupida]SHM89915.1 MarR family transcriptional regulator, transcriptional regulator for hemolysin [Halomonas cupida]
MNDNIGIQLARTPRIWRAVLDQRLAPLGLTQTRWVTLYHLSRMPHGQPQCDLARAIGVEAPSLVRTLDQLCEQGLVERCPCDQDRRTKRIHLTPAAAPLLEKIETIVQEARQEMLAGIDDSDQQKLSELLTRIEANGQALLNPEQADPQQETTTD